ncbi:MAG: BatD family protein [Lentisphaeria bacterium]|nr:BatD family protein [Lentisphaeria bacterium]
MKRTILVLLLVCGAILKVCGFTATAKISPRSMLAGEPGVISISCDAQEEMDFDLPEIKGINWMRNRVSTSRSYSSVNGKVTRAVTKSVYFTVSAPGSYEVPAIAVRAGKQKAYTSPVKFTVSAPGNAPGSSSNVPASARIVWPEIKKFYTGEWIPLEIVLTIPDGMDISRYSYPQLNGIENLIFYNFASRGQRRDFGEVRHERTVYKNVNATQVVFPAAVKAITARIPDISGNITVGTVRRDDRPERSYDSFFDSFFEQSRERIVPLVIPIEKADRKPEILQLPPVPESVYYLDTFGKAEIKAKFSTDKCTAGEAVELIVDVVANDISQLKAPEIKVDGFRVYKPEVKYRGNSAEIRYCFIPVKAGSHKVDIQFASFDTAAGKYDIHSVSQTLDIAPSKQTVTSQEKETTQPEQAEKIPVEEPVKAPSQRTEPLYIKTAQTQGVHLELWRNSIWYYITGFIILPLIAILIVLYRRYARSTPEQQYKNSIIKYAESILKNSSKDSLSDDERSVIRNACACALDIDQSSSASEIADKLSDTELKNWFTSMDEASFNSAAKDSVVLTSDIRKKLLKIFKCCVIMLAFCSSIVNAQNAAKLFDSGKYSEAAGLYKKQLDRNKPSPDILYNIGTCYLKANRPGAARAALLAAHKLAPRDEEITENLNLANRRLSHPEVNKTDTPSRLYKYCRDRLRPDEHLAAAAIIFGIAMLLFALNPSRWKSILGVSMLLIMVFAFLIFDQKYDSYMKNQAVTLPDFLELRELPSGNGNVIATIPSGSDAKLLQIRGDWMEIETNGKTGWVKSDSIALVTH